MPPGDHWSFSAIFLREKARKRKGEWESIKQREGWQFASLDPKFDRHETTYAIKAGHFLNPKIEKGKRDQGTHNVK